MYISKVKINGFRNFVDAEVLFNNKALVLGQNDVGKTNLIYALRLLLDKNLTINDIEPQESDFSIFSTVKKEYSILITFSDINTEQDQKTISKLKGHISDDGEMYLLYRAFYENEVLKYEIKIGSDLLLLEKIDGRDKYINCFSIAFLNSSRDLQNYVKRSKDKLLERTALSRNEEKIKKDENILNKAERDLHRLNKNLESLSYISNSTNMINTSIKQMGSHNFPQNIKFGIKSDIRTLTKSLDLISEINDTPIPSFGGDGRNNQIYLSMWYDETNDKQRENDSTIFYFIEEPETHLHPSFQLSTMRFLLNNIESQLVITTHSPSIASSFLPEDIVRLYFDNFGRTKIANNGCSKDIGDAIYELGYRLNVINSEIYFSRGVILVEGISEKILFEHLAIQLNINLNRENIIIVPVDGVGFEVYVKILKILDIPYVLRTDLDITKKPNKQEWYSGGINRIAKLIENSKLEKYKKYYFEIKSNPIPLANEYFIKKCREQLSKYGYFISYKDLETDLVNSYIFEDLSNYLETTEKDIVIQKMQEHKATFMYEFINETDVDLTKINVMGFIDLINLIRFKVKWYKNGI